MKKRKIIILAVFFSLVATSFVQAETGTVMETSQNQKDGKMTWEEKRKKIEEMKIKQKEWKERKCQEVQKKMQNRIANFDEGKTRRVNAYNNLKDRIAKFITSAKERGYDTRELEANLKVLEGKIQAFSEKYKIFITKLSGKSNYICQSTEEKFRGNLQEARIAIKEVQASAQEIKNYVADVIRPNIKKLKEQKIKTNDNSSMGDME